MPLTETTGESSDETEQARVIECDALLHAASTERESAFSQAAGSNDRGLGRLRLLLGLLEASEIEARNKSGADVAAGTNGGDGDRPVLGRFGNCLNTWDRGAFRFRRPGA